MITVEHFAELIIFGLISVFVIAGVIYIVDEIRSVTIRVKLNSRKEFNNFDPIYFLYDLDARDFERVRALAEGHTKKTILMVKWSYRTPSGKKTYGAVKRYKMNWVKNYVEERSPVFAYGKERIAGLNSLYANRLSSHREPNDLVPKIYCYSVSGFPDKEGLVKVGYAKNSAHKRVDAQFNTAARLKIDYEIHFIMPAISISREEFLDHKVHKILQNSGVQRVEGEWFRCTPDRAMLAVKAAQLNMGKIPKNFSHEDF